MSASDREDARERSDPPGGRSTTPHLEGAPIPQLQCEINTPWNRYKTDPYRVRKLIQDLLTDKSTIKRILKYNREQKGNLDLQEQPCNYGRVSLTGKESAAVRRHDDRKWYPH